MAWQLAQDEDVATVEWALHGAGWRHGEAGGPGTWPGIVVQWTEPWALPSLAAWPWPRGCRLWLLSPCPDMRRVRQGWGDS